MAVHLACPWLHILDKGKAKVQIPPEVAEEIAGALWAATKVLYKEGERRKRDAKRQEDADRRLLRPKSEKGVFRKLFVDDGALMEEALGKATEGGKYPLISAHSLFHVARPLAQGHTDEIL